MKIPRQICRTGSIPVPAIIMIDSILVVGFTRSVILQVCEVIRVGSPFPSRAVDMMSLETSLHGVMTEWLKVPSC